MMQYMVVSHSLSQLMWELAIAQMTPRTKPCLLP